MKLRAFTFFAVVLLFAVDVRAQSDVDAFRYSNTLPAPGGRLMGMAGASAAGVADWGTIYTNPAGLGWMRGSVATGGFGALSVENQSVFAAGSREFDAETSEDFATLSNLSYAYRFPTRRGSLVIGAGYDRRALYGRELGFEGDNLVSSVTESFLPATGTYEIDRERIGDGPDGQPGTADDVYEYTPLFDAGSLALVAFDAFAIDLDPDAFENGDYPFFTLPLPSTTLFQESTVYEEGGLNEFSLAGAYEAARGVMIGGAFNVQTGSYFYSREFTETDVNNENTGNTGSGTADFDQLTFTQMLDSRVSGVNLRFGVSAEVMPSLRVGIGYESPTWLTVEEDFDQGIVTRFDNGDLFEGGDFSRFDYTVRTPWRVNTGVAFSMANFHAALDAEYVDWSSMRLGADDFSFDSVFRETNAAIRQDYEATLNTRLGLELTLGPVALRAGFAHQPDPLDTDRARETFTSGLSFRTGKLEFTLDALRQEFDDTYRPYLASTEAGDPIVTEEITREFATLGVRIKL